MIGSDTNLARRRPWLGTSWKMNKTVAEATQYARRLSAWAQQSSVEASVAIMPPFTALVPVAEVLQREARGVTVDLGAQNMHWEPAGAFTGEISPIMIRDAGASLVEIGHFERRVCFGETDAMVNQKVRAALQHGLEVVLCIGEDQDARQVGAALEYLGLQLKRALHGTPAAALGRIIVAYEPGWAIGTAGISASAEQVDEAHRHIRHTLMGSFGGEAASRVRIVYGGSVTRESVAAYARVRAVDGLFVGRAAWDVSEFVQIIEAFCLERTQLERNALRE